MMRFNYFLNQLVIANANVSTKKKLGREITIGKQSSRGVLEKGGLKNFINFTGEHLCQNTDAWNFIKKGILAQVFSCEFYKIFKNTFFYRTPLVTPSDNKYFILNES